MSADQLALTAVGFVLVMGTGIVSGQWGYNSGWRDGWKARSEYEAGRNEPDPEDGTKRRRAA
jgi:hypothetical protein